MGYWRVRVPVKVMAASGVPDVFIFWRLVTVICVAEGFV
jgi:hypothetical protein